MADHFNELTPAEAERLAFLAEECGEVIQMIGKILRHGYESKDPTNTSAPINRELLAKELGDVLGGIDNLTAALDVDADAVANRRMWRSHSQGGGRLYFHHQGRK